VRVNVGEAKTNLSKLLAQVEAGEEVEIARAGVPVARLVSLPPPEGPGERFLAHWGSLGAKVKIAKDFELSDEEIDEMLAEDVLAPNADER
jgi:prevent-host-death family protein